MDKSMEYGQFLIELMKLIRVKINESNDPKEIIRLSNDYFEIHLNYVRMVVRESSSF